MKKMAFLFAVLIAFVMACGACVYAEEPADSADQTEASDIDYLILVSKQAASMIPDDWEEHAELVETVHPDIGPAIVEKQTLEKFNEMRDALLEEGIDIEVVTGYVSVEDQLTTKQFYYEQFGEDYVAKFVEEPGFSEHHTGLAIDFCFIKDGEPIRVRDKIKQETDALEKLYAILPEYGFILRYPEGKEEVTGAIYQPEHIRYVGSVDVAKEIAEKGITLEEYLGG
jgi:D-alanyl-D-alanine carboxypeptidase